MDPDDQRTLAAWAVLVIGGVGCGVGGVLLGDANAAAALGWYALAVGGALAAGAVPMPKVGDWRPLRE
ncbi:hypothetical protein SAMN06269185_2285 [Natronoarchaeum philippinense]|uniref:Uncharacterized protein n=1 Tax=Natronoarchaeum philippinense TaxID=558529 RepID=A0A285P3Y8_NATPI|nr:hypothetical protein [Natronoarchaeum philippinense]SNZ14866.1 hypothetical protein SAMN06269185_2285 [Natronoarchaeum philippinense]